MKGASDHTASLPQRATDAPEFVLGGVNARSPNGELLSPLGASGVSFPASHWWPACTAEAEDQQVQVGSRERAERMEAGPAGSPWCPGEPWTTRGLCFQKTQRVLRPEYFVPQLTYL